MNFGSGKNLIEYDDVMNYQREIVYNRRNYSSMKKISDELNEAIKEYIDDILDEFCSSSSNINWNFDGLNNELLNIFALDMKIDENSGNLNDLKQSIIDGTNAVLNYKEENFDLKMFNDFKKFIILKNY